ncbi:hypothetical protein EN904_14275 [Mesorhizobium sp. M7A.F.Ca.CA.001.07.2.1]|uniref:hypothetical protein n=1 Tax=Mesorhizobium TaxID=68287 RepID=UPI000FC9F96A|nr:MULTISPECIES: hypothetical protein [Mesorhizobium]RVB21391.1 hypothetical protein EN918_30500 [Mesorhizobium sp. M7A.F.Ca.CA.004.05.1.1]MCF6126577.1 hypothetical protein [Mesorhizobium ciceri]MCQ8817739.1 hypothetical protein [Mesorhizobium sp. SEMIA396]RUX80992.1 hypothetical protein EN983_06250 [Mesorhizobium sp. M7A.F.Ca.CA.004.08.2.1]RUX88414.1 hypothetical protein EN982_06925 [Mesorhizobium sp. M7A.F.Ca.CA.004.08.1.1]
MADLTSGMEARMGEGRRKLVPHIIARVLGFGVDRPSMPLVGKWFFVKDGQALGAAFRRWSDEPDLERATAMSSPTNRAMLKQIARFRA